MGDADVAARLARRTRRARRNPGATALLALAGYLLASALAAPATAQAHVPFLEPSWTEHQAKPVPLPAPDVSRAAYGYLEPSRDFDRYAFSVEETVATRVDLLVPMREDARGFNPWLALRGGGMRPMSAEASFFEPFSLSSFRVAESVEATFVPDKKYVLYVNAGEGKRDSGPYVVGFGGEEAFSEPDWRETLTMLPRIWLGSWAGAPMRPQVNIVLFAIGVLALVAAAILFAWIGKGALNRWRARGSARDSVGG